MHSLHKHVMQKWSEFVPGHFLFELALSGGIDSVVLLHILYELHKQGKMCLSAVHINHGISPNAHQWEIFCSNLCTSMNIQLRIAHYQVRKNGGESLENNARKVRYNEFLNSKAGVIVLAHHQTDQIETVLSQIFRGSDLHNIAAMQPLSIRQDKILWRPLLEIPRKKIEMYASEFNLQHIEDESNLDHNYLRNFIRHRIMPTLLEFDPEINGKILKLPQQLQSLLSLTDETATVDFSAVSHSGAGRNPAIDLDKFKTLSQQRQQQVICFYLKRQNLTLPSSKQLSEFIRQALNCRWDREPSLNIKNEYKIIKSKNLIRIEKLNYD